MFERLKRGRRKYGLARYLVRESDNHINRWLFKSTKEALVEAFRSIGMGRRSTVCVHASLSRIGYVEGGADTVVDALIEAVGPSGCIMMPSFSTSGSMLSYIEADEKFDVLRTPSRVGAIAEAFRRRHGVVRSLHPTNSVTAFGLGAEELVRDHEKSLTPYGFSTPYGRLADRSDAYILMLNTHVHSLLHHIQERVDFPNLFLREEREVGFVDHDGVNRTMLTKIMRPRIPYYVAIPSLSASDPDWAILHDFALMFPRRREKTVRQLGYQCDGFKALYERRQRLVADGSLVSRRLGRGEIGMLHVARFIRAIQPELEESIRRFRRYYSVESLRNMNLRYG